MCLLLNVRTNCTYGNLLMYLLLLNTYLLRLLLYTAGDTYSCYAASNEDRRWWSMSRTTTS